MKKILMLLTALLAVAGLAQDRVVERTYLSTDRDVYVAGETLWYSAFCLDAAKGTLTTVSSVAYVELHDAEKMVASGKVALLNGRGAGQLTIPGSLPTGNYRLVVYTSQNKAEQGYDYNGLASKTVSVFNVFSGDRVKDGVELVDAEEYERCRIKSVIPGPDRASLNVVWRDSVLEVTNNGASRATFSLSVTHDDGFASNGNPTIADFTAQARRVGPRSFDNSILPDFEGEIIRGHISGFSEEILPKLLGKFAFISTPSTKSDVYSSVIDTDGKVAFFTGNIYGTKEYICEIEGIDPSLNCFIELESPFVNAKVAAPEKLRMSESLREPLRARSVAMQIERHFTSDTLLDPLSVRQCGLFGEHEIVYHLDDYTRFTTMEEVLIEFVAEMRARRRSDGSRDIQVRLSEIASNPIFSSGSALMMLDGVPVFDHEKIMQYDPLLVESIDIYPHTHFIGNRIFEGVVNFVTYKRNLPSFRFDANARVIDYQGVCVPMAFTGASIPEDGSYPDYRQTIYWHPLVEVGAGENRPVQVRFPQYKGRFTAVAEGMTASGEAVVRRISFEVR